MDVRERLARLNEVLKHRSLVRADGPAMAPKNKHRRGEPAVIVRRTHGINLWVPMLKTGARVRGLRVPCGWDTPDREQFRTLMQQHLESLILSNPTLAQEQIEEFSDMWQTPDLDAIQLKFPVDEWAAQLVICDHFNRTLERIGWGYRNPPQSPLEQPCALGEFISTVWEETPPL